MCGINNILIAVKGGTHHKKKGYYSFDIIVVVVRDLNKDRPLYMAPVYVHI